MVLIRRDAAAPAEEVAPQQQPPMNDQAEDGDQAEGGGLAEDGDHAEGELATETVQQPIFYEWSSDAYEVRRFVRARRLLAVACYRAVRGLQARGGGIIGAAFDFIVSTLIFLWHWLWSSSGCFCMLIVLYIVADILRWIGGVVAVALVSPRAMPPP